MRSAIAVSAALSLVSGVASAQEYELEELEGRAGAFGKRIEALAVNVDAALQQTSRTFNERLEFGLNLFLADDYVNAGIVLDGLVRAGSEEDRRNRRESRYFEAVYHLGRCFYEMDQMAGARAEFERVVGERNPRYLENAVRYLIRIGARTRQWDRVDQHVETLKELGSLQSETAYLYMKGLMRNEQPLRAKRTFPLIGKNATEWRIKGKYLAAVADVALGNLDEARGLFQELRKEDFEFRGAAEIRNLAAMNVGRLFLEEGDLTNAIDAYQDVARDSEHFERSLFEVTWTFVRAGSRTEDRGEQEAEYLKAVRALDILLLAESERPVVPEARLLLGNIRLRMDDFTEATESFTTVVNTYAPVKKELGYLTSEDAEPEDYYEEVVERRDSGGSLLPELALNWATDEENFEVAQLVVNDLDVSDAWLRESNELLSTLQNLLSSDADRAAFFPRLRGVQGQIVDARNRLFSLEEELVAVELEALDDVFSAEESKELAQLEATLKRLEPQYKGLPQRIEEYRARADTMRDELKELLGQLLTFELVLKNSSRELVELTRLLSTKSEEMTSEVQADAQEWIDQSAAEVDAAKEQLERLRAEVRQKRDLISDTMEKGTKAEGVRSSYQAAVDRQQSIVDGALARAGRSRLIQGVRRQLDVLRGYSSRIEELDSRLQREVNVESMQMVSELLNIRDNLASSEEELGYQRKSARNVVGQVAVESMSRVEEQFDNILLRADVGIVDVAWAEKEATTREITNKVTEQRRELERFDAEYQEVLSEED